MVTGTSTSCDPTAALFAINIDTGSVRQLTKTAAAESFPAWSPDGQWIAYTSSAAGQPMNLFRIRSDGSEVVQLTNDHTRSLYPRWSPDGRQLAFFSRRDTSGTDDEVYVLDLVTQQTSRWTSRPGHDFSPAWMADGRAIAMISLDAKGDRALRVVNVDGSTRCRVLGVERVSDPAPGPDGRRIAYAAAAGQYLAIVVHTLDAAPADCR